MDKEPSPQALLCENEELRTRLAEAEEVLRAIRQGEVDAVVVEGPLGEQGYTLKGADHPYRLMVETMNEGAATVGADDSVLYCNHRLAALLDTPIERVIGSPFNRFVVPGDRLRFEILREQGEAGRSTGEVTLKARYGRQVPVLLSFSSLPLEEGRGVCLVVTDLTEQKRQASILAAWQLAREREERLRLALEAARMGTWEWDAVTDTVVEDDHVRQLVGIIGPGGLNAFLAKVHPHDRESVRSQVQCVIAERVSYHLEFRIVLPSGQVRWMEVHAHPRFEATGQLAGMIGVVQDVTERKQAENALKAIHERCRRLSAHLQEIREEERARIAREIHDELGATLTALRMDLSLAMQAEAKHGNRRRHPFAHMLQLVDSAIQTMRKITTDLRPSILDNLGLWAALEWQAQDLQGRTGITCSLKIDDSTEGCPLKEELATALFRIVQEALTNVVRHAQASRIEIEAYYRNGEVIIEIKDDGRGITEAELLNPRSWGILGMHERARQYGGELEVQGKVGQGTRVCVRMPVEDSRAS